MAETAPVPFKGLTPYTEEDARFFFGRVKEERIITANLLAYPLTLLYGATGVGKTSILRAAVAHQLRQQARTNVAERGKPELVVAVVNDWRGDPLQTMRQQIEEALDELYPAALAGPLPEDLGEALAVWAERIEGPVLVILDQFEEYFLYHADEDGPGTFAQDFPRIVDYDAILANFAVTVREDCMAWLDRFETRLPNLFDNHLRIRHLDRASAREAITSPIQEYNRLQSAREPAVTVEPALIEALLEQIRFGQVIFGARRPGLAGRESAIGPAQGLIETPYLQLVMRRLWDVEHDRGSRVLRLTTFQELGGAEHIIRRYLDASMDELAKVEQGIAASVFQCLLTSSGTKVSHLLADLSQYTGTGEDKLVPVLRSLADARILRQARPASHQSNMLCYEIFHEVLAPAIVDWRTRYVEECARIEAREQLERQLGIVREEA